MTFELWQLLEVILHQSEENLRFGKLLDLLSISGTSTGVYMYIVGNRILLSHTLYPHSFSNRPVSIMLTKLRMLVTNLILQS